MELASYVKHLTAVHKAIFQQVKGGAVGRRSEIAEELRQVQPGDYVYIRVFMRKHWDQPRNEGPFKPLHGSDWSQHPTLMESIGVA